MRDMLAPWASSTILGPCVKPPLSLREQKVEKRQPRDESLKELNLTTFLERTREDTITK